MTGDPRMQVLWRKEQRLKVCVCVFGHVLVGAETLAGFHFPPVASHISCHETHLSLPLSLPLLLQVRKAKSDDTPEALPQPTCSAHLSHVRPHFVTLLLPLTSELRSPSPEAMETTPRSEASESESTDTTLLPGHLDVSPSGSGETLLRSV